MVDFFYAIGEEPPPKISAIVGDVIHNLRSSLDQLTCALVRIRDERLRCEKGGARKPSIAFPVGKNRKSFDGILTGYVKKIPSGAERVFRELQPYGGGKGKLLWKLHSLDIRDKHRLMLLLKPEAPTMAEIELIYGPRDETVVNDERIIYISVGKTIGADGGPIWMPDGKHHITTRTRAFLAQYPEFDIKLKPTGYIAFGEPWPFYGKSVIATLTEFRDEVEKVIGMFEPFFR